ncbi:hypothetical protein B0H34DRAFT_387843 [Crassisporium funariophilum]|nr:hypothetical protein B0H34DRAFT_387843 [Crassisporium funariophilum]
MPVFRNRQPLRSRCNVKLSVLTSASDHDLYCYDQNCGKPHSRSIRDRGYTQKRVAYMKDLTTKPNPRGIVNAPHKQKISTYTSSTPTPAPLECPLEAYHELVPFLSLALSDNYNPSTTRPPITSSTASTSAIPFSHFIQIHHSDPTSSSPNLSKPARIWTEYTQHTSTLHLTIPDFSSGFVKHRPTRTYTLLTTTQLLRARDFLSLALPYYPKAVPPSIPATDKNQDLVHALVTAPPNEGAADVMCVVASYLAFAGGEEPKRVIRCMDEEVWKMGEGMGHVWSGKVDRESVDKIVRVADM